MEPAYRRHAASDKDWNVLEPLLPGLKGTWGGNARDSRQFLNGVFWILRTGAPWRGLPPYYGDRKNTHRRFCRWRNWGVREKILETPVDDPDY
jgi:transposase